MSEDLIHKHIPRLSAATRKFWGTPPIFGSESEEAYWSFAAAIVAGIDPGDVVMLLMAKDFVDHSFQIRELRKIKANLLKLERATKLGQVLPKDAKERATYLLSDIGETELFLSSMTSFVAIDEIIANTEQRRDDALAQIEFYREAVAMRLRRNAEAEVIEGEVIEFRHQFHHGNDRGIE